MKITQVFFICLLSSLQVRCDVSELVNNGIQNSNSWSNYKIQLSPLKPWRPITTSSPVTSAPSNNYVSYDPPVQPTRSPLQNNHYHQQQQDITSTIAPTTTSTPSYLPQQADWPQSGSTSQQSGSWPQQSSSLPQQTESWSQIGSWQQHGSVPQQSDVWSLQTSSGIQQPNQHQSVWQNPMPSISSQSMNSFLETNVPLPPIPNAVINLSSFNLTPMTQAKFLNQQRSENKDKKSSPVMPQPLPVMMPPKMSSSQNDWILQQNRPQPLTQGNYFRNPPSNQYLPQVNNHQMYLAQAPQHNYYHWMIRNNIGGSFPRSNIGWNFPTGGNSAWNLGSGGHIGWDSPLSGGNNGWNLPSTGVNNGWRMPSGGNNAFNLLSGENPGWNLPVSGGTSGWDSSFGGNNGWNLLSGGNNGWNSPSSGSNDVWNSQSFGGNNGWKSPSFRSNNKWNLPSFGGNNAWDSSSGENSEWNFIPSSSSGESNIWSSSSLGSGSSSIPWNRHSNGNSEVSYWPSQKRK